MKKMIVVGILGMVLVSLASAGLLDIFGKIEGSVEVSGPVFYASAEHLVDDNDTQYWGLGIGEYEDRSTPVTFTGGDTKWFISESLGVEKFYAAEWKISVHAESTANSLLNETGQIDAEIWFVGGDSTNKKQFVCMGSTSEDVDVEDVYVISCDADELTDLDEDWRLALILSDGANSIKYSVYIDGETKIKVTAI